MISIVIPTCNEENDVGRLIDCLLPLSLEKEIIVTDDASTDKTVEVLRKYQGKIKVLAHEQRHKSIAANRNAGAREASGEFLVFMDGTTYLENPDDFFRRALIMFENDKKLLGITARLKVLRQYEVCMDKVMHFLFNAVVMLKNNYLGMAEASGKFEMIRQSAFEKVGGFNENLVTREDSNMFKRLSGIGKIKYAGNLLVLYTGRRQHILGWPRLLLRWMTEAFWVGVFGKTKSKEWEVIR
jgi:glycosyltransferase involved in cell wall biosynthesis